jgi:hypothetical protein
MSEQRRQILEMLGKGKISAQEAEQLLDALGEGSAPAAIGTLAPIEQKARPKYLRVLVKAGDGGGKDAANVDVRVPLQLIRAGVKLGALIPKDAQVQVNEKLQEQGINIDLANIPPEMLDELIDSLGELTVNVDAGDDESGGAVVRVFCE